MKKTASFILMVIFVFTAFMGMAAAAPPYEGDIDSNAVMLLDATTGQVLFEKNADEQILPASTTKIMTCIVALENASLDDMVTVGPEGDWTGSGYSLMGLKNGQQLSLRELIYGMMLISGNDAAAAIAVHVGGSLEGFADMMNQKAQELGMTGSHFITSHGADTEGHYVTARDMATLSLYAMKNEQFMQIVGSASHDFPSMSSLTEKDKRNTNKLLISNVLEGETNYYYEYATGIKTGSTPKAFRCLVSSAEKDGMKLLCLIFGDETTDGTERWPLAKDLFEYGFNNYQTVNLQSAIDSAAPVSVTVADASADDAQGGELVLNAVYAGAPEVTLDKTLAQSVAQAGLVATVELSSGEQLRAPVKAGDTVGVVKYHAQSGEEVAQAQLVASRDVADATGLAPAPLDEDAAANPYPVTDDSDPWLWLVLAVVLAAAVLLLIVNLARGRKKKARRNYARRSSGAYRNTRGGRR